MSENERLLSLNLTAGTKPSLYIRATTAEEIAAALDEVRAAGLFEAIAEAHSAFGRATASPDGMLFR